MGRKERHSIIVGVDFGTTYTGVNYAWTNFNDDSEIVAINQWPTYGKLREFAAKAPTQIAYAEDNEGIPKNCWGYQLRAGMARYSWMKLILDEDARQTPYDDPDLQRDIKEGILKVPKDKSARSITADYFRELYAFTMEKLQHDYAEMLGITPIQFWFTMPAIWSDKAQVTTLDAAREAGFGSRPDDEMCMITEPEAAALATLSSETLRYGDLIQKDEVVLLCDCGGGTVVSATSVEVRRTAHSTKDIIVYKIVNKDPLELDEVCVGSGGKCGSTYIDRNFHRLISDRYKTSFNSLRRELVGQGSAFMRAFESNKRVFGMVGAELRDLPLRMDNVSHADHYDDEDGEIKITNKDMETVFEPVVGIIIEMVSKQVEKAESSGNTPVTNVVLVGGLGDSPYLKAKLGSWCAEKNIALRVPGNGWGAIVKGAVIRGLEKATVIKKRCRRHYGVRVSQPFSAKDKESDGFMCPFTKRKMASGYMSWSIKKGQEIMPNMFEEFEFYQSLDASARTVDTELMSCDLDDAPERYDPSDIDTMGQIVTSLINVDLTRFQAIYQDGRKRYKFDHVFEVVLGAKEGTISFRVRCQGKIVGETSIDFSK